MVRVNAPAMSLDASGSLAGALVFSKWKGRNYVRQLVIPSNPRSAGQQSVRGMFKFLSQIWNGIAANRKATWEDRADDKIVSPFNAFMGYNQSRWRNFLAPTQSDPAEAAVSTADFINEAAAATARSITVSGTIDGVGGHWGVMIFRQTTTPVVTAYSNLIAAIATPLHQVYKYVDTPLEPDQYYYNFRLFSVEGYLGAEETEVNATVV